MIEYSIPNYVSTFLGKHTIFVSKMSRKVCDGKGGGRQLSEDAFLSELKMDLETAHNTFFSKERKSQDPESYLLGTVHNFVRKKNQFGKVMRAICPACQFKGSIRPIMLTKGINRCNYCEIMKTEAIREEDKILHSAFAECSSKGYRCLRCTRYIPDEKKDAIVCPYPGCRFENIKGKLASANSPRLHLPWKSVSCDGTVDYPEIIDTSNLLNDKLVEEAQVMIRECIEDQIKTLHFKCFPSTYAVNLSMYEAFLQCLHDIPEDLVPYLCSIKRTADFPHLQGKIFNQFVTQIERKLPYVFSKGGKKIEVKSLLDENLTLFAGESSFVSEVLETARIPNRTQELYTKGPAAYHLKPYSIGKLLSIKTIDGIDLSSKVVSHSRDEIVMREVKLGTKVEIRHLRMSPHPQMGGFVYLNRIKKHLSERIQVKVSGSEKMAS